MKYIHDTIKDLKIDEHTVIALGNFDGLHKGHRQLINTCKKISDESNVKSVVFSFYPHPSHVLEHLETVPIIYTREEKKLLLETMNVDYYVEYPFSIESSKMLPKDFVKEVLVDKLKVKHIVVGSNYRFGYRRQGDTQLLKELGQIYDYEVFIIHNVTDHNQMVSSTHIRGLLSEGKIEQVNALLTRPYFVQSTVSYGKQLGRTLGFPTINFTPDIHKQYPATGVYVSRTTVKGRAFMSVTSVGYNPTISSNNKQTIETHILGFNEDIYHQTVKVEFLSKIRDEQNFPNLNELIKQMDKDVNFTRQYFS